MSLLEVIFAAGVFATASMIAVQPITAAIDDVRARSAARHLSGRLQQARALAVLRSSHVAIRFTQSGDGYSFAVYADGNGNGVRTADIGDGVDLPIGPELRLTDHFPGVEFGAWQGLPALESGSTPPGNDPIRIGTSDLLTFSALGTATPGTLYFGTARHQYALRIFGETGRTRLLRFNRSTGTWQPL